MENLKNIREKNNITQKKLSEILHCSQTLISKWEKGLREPSFEIVKKTAQYFNCSIDYLLGFSDEQTPHPTPAEVKEELTDKQKELLSLIKNMDNDDINKIIGYAFSLNEKELTTEEKIEKLLKLKN